VYRVFEPPQETRQFGGHSGIVKVGLNQDSSAGLVFSLSGARTHYGDFLEKGLPRIGSLNRTGLKGALDRGKPWIAAQQ
jgi:hypothetical protein